MNEITNEKYMTIKEISNLCDVSEKTVRRIVKDVLEITGKRGHKLKFNHDQSKEIIDNVSKKGNLEIGQNVQTPINTSSLTDKDIQMIGTIVSMTVAKTIEALDGRMSNIENRFEERKALLPAPKKSDRQNLNQVIRSYVEKNDVLHAMAWNILYEETYYRLKINIKTRAKNNKMKVLDYAEDNGYVSDLLSIAMDIFK